MLTEQPAFPREGVCFQTKVAEIRLASKNRPPRAIAA